MLIWVEHLAESLPPSLFYDFFFFWLHLQDAKISRLEIVTTAGSLTL